MKPCHDRRKLISRVECVKALLAWLSISLLVLSELLLSWYYSTHKMSDDDSRVFVNNQQKSRMMWTTGCSPTGYWSSVDNTCSLIDTLGNAPYCYAPLIINRLFIHLHSNQEWRQLASTFEGNGDTPATRTCTSVKMASLDAALFPNYFGKLVEISLRNFRGVKTQTVNTVCRHNRRYISISCKRPYCATVGRLQCLAVFICAVDSNISKLYKAQNLLAHVVRV